MSTETKPLVWEDHKTWSEAPLDPWLGSPRHCVDYVVYPERCEYIARYRHPSEKWQSAYPTRESAKAACEKYHQENQ